jgi:hypothetical protein
MSADISTPARPARPDWRRHLGVLAALAVWWLV